MTFEHLILFLHLLGAGVLIGVAVFAVTLTVRPPIRPDKLNMLLLLAKAGRIAAGWQFITGVILAWINWDNIHSISWFWVKLVLFVLSGFIAEKLIKEKTSLALKGDNIAVQQLTTNSWILAVIILIIVGIGFALVEIF